MENGLEKLFSIQSSYIKLTAFQNEFETMRILYEYLTENKRKFVRNLSLQWLQNLNHMEDKEFDLKDNSEKIKESIDLREQGNRLFTGKVDKRNILGACRLYNDAIYAALDTKSVELALGYANRAAALQTFGYYQQAYDDCVCALKFGYPKSLVHKIMLRQAYCSIKMHDLEQAERHLEELRKFTISAGFSKELEQLLKAFEELKQEENNDSGYSNAVKDISLTRETQEIIPTKNGRCMKAKCSIQKNQLIFTERATAFVAVGDTRRMCHQCGTVNFIPFPCLHCRGRVNYCSLKCQEEHIDIHVFECPAYRFQLFAHVGIAHLALRVVLDKGLTAILDKLNLNDKSSTSELWCKLNEGGDVWKDESIAYAESLRMISHLNRWPLISIKWFALVSYLLVVYLKHYTKYFETLNSMNATLNWELLISSLILRHIGQLVANGHSLTTIIPQPITLMTTTEFHMLNEKIWSSPWHLKLGFLHFFSHYDNVAALSLPYLSLCNHSCVQIFQTKFSGRFVSTYALRCLKKGDEITNCYDVDCRKDKRQKRRKRLLETYNFECQCEDCLQTDSEDIEFNKYCQYRCENTKCGQIFIPNTNEFFMFSLLKSDRLKAKDIFCTACGATQNLNWYHESYSLISTVTEARTRRRLYTIFKESEQYLVGLNKARCCLAQIFINEWFKLFWLNAALDDQDYCDLVDMLKFVFCVTRSRSSVNSLEYVVNITYLWDLVAQRKYKSSSAEMDEMLWALNIISDDLKVVFLNYYNDYIKE